MVYSTNDPIHKHEGFDFLLSWNGIMKKKMILFWTCVMVPGN